VFAYSDVPHAHVMHVASRALAAGATFVLPGPNDTMLSSTRPVIAITVLRTGSGKSSVARWLARRLRDAGCKVAVIRHPMPYGQLACQRVQRLVTLVDLTDAQCTTEEREEYEPHIALGTIVFAGVDYAAIRRASPDIVVCATPANLAASILIGSRVTRARYDFVEDPTAPLTPLVDAFLAGRRPSDAQEHASTHRR
jgi:predicted GTPase